MATGADATALVRVKVWIEREGEVVLSEWRVELLAAVDAHGSLARAAEAIGVPYRTAWERVRETEAALGVRLLASESGGAAGGGSRLTPAGRDVVERFRRAVAGTHEAVAARMRAELGDLLDGTPRPLQ